MLRQQLPVAVEEYVSEQLEATRKREGEDDWPAPRRGDVAGNWSWKGAEALPFRAGQPSNVFCYKGSTYLLTYASGKFIA